MENAVSTSSAGAIEEDHFAVVAPNGPHKTQNPVMTPEIYVSITTLRPEVFLNTVVSIVRWDRIVPMDSNVTMSSS